MWIGPNRHTKLERRNQNNTVNSKTDKSNVVPMMIRKAKPLKQSEKVRKEDY